MSVQPDELERAIAELRRELVRELERGLAKVLAEFERALTSEVSTLHRRIDEVHSRALVALTRRISGGA